MADSTQSDARLRDILATEGLGVSAYDVLCLLRHELNVYIPQYHGDRPTDEQIAFLNAKVDGALNSLREREIWPREETP